MLVATLPYIHTCGSCGYTDSTDEYFGYVCGVCRAEFCADCGGDRDDMCKHCAERHLELVCTPVEDLTDAEFCELEDIDEAIRLFGRRAAR